MRQPHSFYNNNGCDIHSFVCFETQVLGHIISTKLAEVKNVVESVQI